MFSIELSLTSPDPEGRFPLIPPGGFVPDPDRKRLRHMIVGVPVDVQAAIDRLHLCGYCDRDDWSRTIHVPNGGILVSPDPGDTLRYLERWRSVR